MNENMKKRSRRYLTFLLAVTLCCSCLAGCANTESAQKPTETQETIDAEVFQTTETEEETVQTEMTLPAEPQWEGDYLTNILIVGQASRYGEDAKLADSIILATIDPKNKSVTLTSFLRDSYVQIPSYAGRLCGGMHRINIIYNLGCRWNGKYGGMEMMDLLMEESFGVHVDYNVEIDFETFYHVIDSLGGIEIDVTEAERDYLLKDITGMNDHVVTGKNLVNGYTALCYARMRKIDSDIARTGRQRKVISAALDRCKELSIHELAKLIGQVSQMVTTDMSVLEIADLVRIVMPMLQDLTIETAQCPAEDTYWGETIPLDGYMSSVIKFNLKPNRDLLVERCEIPEETEEAE